MWRENEHKKKNRLGFFFFFFCLNLWFVGTKNSFPNKPPLFLCGRKCHSYAKELLVENLWRFLGKQLRNIKWHYLININTVFCIDLMKMFFAHKYLHFWIRMLNLAFFRFKPGVQPHLIFKNNKLLISALILLVNGD